MRTPLLYVTVVLAIVGHILCSGTYSPAWSNPRPDGDKIQSEEARNAMLFADKTCAAPRPDGGPLPVGELLAAGNKMLAASQSALTGSGALSRLATAEDCFDRARQLAPENYSANLGLGVVHLARAKRFHRGGPYARRELLLARERIGTAFFLRQGHREPVYYLAEVAYYLEDYDKARELLQPLMEARWNEGPVYALAGEIAAATEKSAPHAPDCGREPQWSLCHYMRSMQAGWPPATVNYITKKIGLRKAGRYMLNMRVGFSNLFREQNAVEARLYNNPSASGSSAAFNPLGFFYELEGAAALNRSRTVALTIPLQLQLGYTWRLVVPLGMQFDFELPARWLYIEARIAGAYAYTAPGAIGEARDTHQGGGLVNLGLKYTAAGRWNLGLEPLGLLALFPTGELSYQGSLQLGVNL